ncbi:peptidoglycan DD-metalloendopeptidase family protein [Proteiniphilum sp. X52]|uniref:peptidoglycan DD-metalloendopeptidase family protein n=1 Tax=Proteiniphilum sp. X52 TaxID=2382159 RepID=UPI000F0A1829|nr:peptidoglycan DD-metalloendopeptidase family protein [Proteiniphilum sp. X52]RNC63501.1 LysM peptidoglycan-binding domain-containing protein [Proteiniphilum sp. X52]
MERNHFLAKAGTLLSASLMFVTLNAFSQLSPESNGNTRPDLTYKQLHSSTLSEQPGLFADGLKLKLDLSVLDEVEEDRFEFDPDAIPADDIYGGMWGNRYVNTYGDLKNAPDTFIVDLENFTMPVDGYMTSNFGRRGSRRYHYGVDLKAQTGDTIYAAFDGKIRVKQYERRGYGYYLVIRHLNGLETVYGHLSKFLVDENDFVQSGQPIGLAGNTGRSFGSHLHFETRFLGKPINPNFIIDFQKKAPHKEEYLVTNSSYRKTSNSSRVVVKSNMDNTVATASASTNRTPAKNANTNKYVSGEVNYHRIRKGDTLGAIAKRYGTSVNKICSLNNITPRTTLRVGNSIRIS